MATTKITDCTIYLLEKYVVYSYLATGWLTPDSNIISPLTTTPTKRPKVRSYIMIKEARLVVPLTSHIRVPPVLPLDRTRRIP